MCMYLPIFKIKNIIRWCLYILYIYYVISYLCYFNIVRCIYNGR